MSNAEKVVTIQKKEISMTAGQFMESYLLACKFPNGNVCLTVRKNAKLDKDVLAMANAFGVPTFEIPKDK